MTTHISQGVTVGRLEVLRMAGGKSECRCQCGTVKWIDPRNLRNGSTLSCGCLKLETAGQHSVTHGKARTGRNRSKEYRTWAHIIDRCHNSSNPGFKDYGGRGITVHPSWRDSFESFHSYVGDAPSSDHSLDRWPNNDGNYEPGNVRWATRSQQARNTRRTIFVDGVCLKDVCEARGVSYDAAQMRIRRGQQPAEAIKQLEVKK